MDNVNILEVTKENKTKYLDQIAKLEEKVLKDMEAKGKTGQLFITGKEDIEQYIDSNENTVIIAIDEKSNVKAATYITQGQSPFTYNDITKYFKYGNGYKEYVKSLYNSNEKYKIDMLKTYELKMKAYKYATEKILQQFPEYEDIQQFLQHELDDKQNKFHEKSQLRELINKYMIQYVAENAPQYKDLYEKFYWITLNDIQQEFGKEIDKKNIKNNSVIEYEKFINSEISREFTDIIQKGKLQIYNEPKFDIKKYYTANTENSVEIDTYITDPDCRQLGIARMLVFEGIKKHIEKQFKKQDNDIVFLCSTLHKNNFSSKYVSEFFGLKDNLFVKRREGRNREVHICKIQRESAQDYLEHIENKLIVFYGYNPHNKQITDEERISILKEQIEYEKDEVERLRKIKKKNNKNLKGKINIESKREKIEKMKGQIKQINAKKRQEGEIEL